MAGFSIISGDEAIMNADNASFDGTARGGKMTTDGQLWIGATASPHVRLGTLTAGTGITITDGPGTITIASSAAATDLHTARLIVSAAGTIGTGANYGTITAALAASVAGDTIFIMPGTYNENLTALNNVNLAAYPDAQMLGTVTINGKISVGDNVNCAFFGLRLANNGDNVFVVNNTATSRIFLNNCYIICQGNATAISFTSNDTNSVLTLYNCRGDISGTSTKLFAFNSTGQAFLYNCYFTNGSQIGIASTTASTLGPSGTMTMFDCDMPIAVTTSGTANYIATNCSWNTEGTFIGDADQTWLTIGGSGTNMIDNCFIDSRTSSAISISQTATVANCVIKTSNASAIAGAGTINFGNLTFSGTSSNIATTTQVPLVQSNNAVRITTPGAYPYTTIPQDAVILVDTSSARTITPLASPTTGQMHVIKDNVGSAAANNITITPSGKNIDGAASSVINVNYGSLTICYNGTEWSIL